jgi:predicted Fe-S protein YdhL (DUF1289 family)
MTPQGSGPAPSGVEVRALRGPPSPCVGICVIQPATGWCQGCRRTLGEIAHWSGATPTEQWQILERLSHRAHFGESAP